jgi:hypothetical protein
MRRFLAVSRDLLSRLGRFSNPDFVHRRARFIVEPGSGFGDSQADFLVDLRSAWGTVLRNAGTFSLPCRQNSGDDCKYGRINPSNS